MQVVNVDIYHFLVHLPYKLHAITVYLSHGIPPGGWAWLAICLSCVGSLHANLLFQNMQGFGASFTKKNYKVQLQNNMATLPALAEFCLILFGTYLNYLNLWLHCYCPLLHHKTFRRN